MTSGVYGIFDVRTDECLYVGQSACIEDRWRSHTKRLRLGSHLEAFNQWFTDNGCDSGLLDLRVLEETKNSTEAKNLAEIQWFESLSPRFFGQKPSLSRKGWSQSEETKKKISVGVCKAINGTDYKAKYLYTCSQCGVEFDAKRKKTEKRTFCSRDCLWKSQAVDKVEKPKKYKWLKNAVSKECLFRLYWIEMKSTTEIGKMLGVSSSTVILNMEKLGIPRRPRNHN